LFVAIIDAIIISGDADGLHLLFSNTSITPRGVSPFGF
jgi:hypothetical protein